MIPKKLYTGSIIDKYSSSVCKVKYGEMSKYTDCPVYERHLKSFKNLSNKIETVVYEIEK